MISFVFLLFLAPSGRSDGTSEPANRRVAPQKTRLKVLGFWLVRALPPRVRKLFASGALFGEPIELVLVIELVDSTADLVAHAEIPEELAQIPQRRSDKT